MDRRTVFFVSDQTGVTAETLGHSLMTQFEGLEFRPVTLPFVSSLDKAHEAVRRIDRAAQEQGLRPIVFSTLVQDELRDVVITANALFLDLFSAFVGPLERELNTRSTHRAGRAHGIADLAAYTTRINATNFALANDDGSGGDYAHADVVLVGVSRVGKTPTCVYMALQYGVFAANYPLTEDDLEAGRLPPRLETFRSQALRTHHPSGTTAADPPRAPARQPLRLAAAGAVRAARGRGDVRALRDPVARHHRVFDRGDLQPHSEHHRHRAAPAPMSGAPRS